MVDSGDSNLGDYPLKDIPHPHPHDVLCGRGGGSNNWIGNSHWRMLVAANKQLYVTLPKRQKMLLSRSIVHAVRSQNPPGRFLQKDSKSDRWYDIGDQRAQEKTSQALREGAPELRTKLKDDKPKSSSSSKANSGQATESRSDDGAKSPAPGDGGDSHSVQPAAPSNPPSRAPSGAVAAAAAPNLSQQTSTTSVGQVLPPAASAQSMQPMATSSMPPPAMRPNQINDSHQSQQQQQQSRQQDQQQRFQQQQQQQQQQQHMNQSMPMMMQNLQNMQNMQNGMQMMQPMPGQHPQQMMNGMYFPGANMNMNGMNGMNMNGMPMYPAMMYNQQGMMVPVMSMMPPNVGNAQGPNSNNGSNQQKGKHSGNDGNNDQRQQKHSNQNQFGQQQQRLSHGGNGSNFDQKLEGMALPPDGLEAGGLSFGSIGSIMMSENEMKRLETGGNSFGTAMSFNNNNHSGHNNNNMQQNQQRQQQLFMQQQYLQQQQQFMEQYQQQQQQQQFTGQNPHMQLPPNFQANANDKSNNDDLKNVAPPPDGGLEPQGLSFGSVSLMSIGDAKLEPTGVSFGSAMSFNMMPHAVDGGLDGIGMSFGSMTLATTNEDQYDPNQNPHNIIPPPPSGPTAAKSTDTLPTLFHQNRSGGNLLDCSDTDSDNDAEQSAARSQHKSLEWEKMKSLVSGNGGRNPNSAEPLPLPPNQSFPSSFAMPNTTTFARDFSQMSQLSAGDHGDNDPGGLQSLMAAAAMPPPPPKKTDEDGEWQNAELLMLKTQQSAASNNNFGGGLR